MRKLFFNFDSNNQKITITKVENFKECECGQFTMSAGSESYFDFKFKRPDGSVVELHKTTLCNALCVIEKYIEKEDLATLCDNFFVFGKILAYKEVMSRK